MHTDLLTGHFLTDSSHSLMAREGIFKEAVLHLVSALSFLKDIPSGVFFFCLSTSESDATSPNVSFHAAAH